MSRSRSTSSSLQHQFNKIDQQSQDQIHFLINQFKENPQNHFIVKQIQKILHSTDEDVQSLIESIEQIHLKITNEEEEDEMISYRIQLIKGQSYYFDLVNPSIEMEIPCDQCFHLSSNNKYFLLLGKSFISFYNQHLKFMKRKRFNESQLIQDIHWSNILQRFLFISLRHLFIVEEKTMIIRRYPLNVPFESRWSRLTCSEKYLFISMYGMNPFVVQFGLFPSILFEKKRKKEFHLDKNHLINQMNSKKNLIYLTIEDHLLNKSFIRIFDENSFEMVGQIFIGTGWNYRMNLFDRYLIVFDQTKNCFIYLNDQGEILKKEFYFTKSIQFVPLTNCQMLIQTKSHLNLHETP